MSTRIRAISCLVVLWAAAPSRAATYPVGARLQMVPDARCPAMPECSALETVRSAFASAVARMFSPRAPVTLDLLLAVRRLEIVSMPARQLELSTHVRVMGPDAELIEEVDADSIAPLLSADPEAIASAVQYAASDAARAFERSYANDARIADYLVAKKLAPAAEVLRERSDRLVTLALGAGVIQGSGDGALTLAPSLRVAVSLRRFFVQAMASRYTASFQGMDEHGQPIHIPSLAASELTTNAVGIEAGMVFRFTRALELRVGPGVHFVFGDGAVEPPYGPWSQPFSKVVPTFFSSISSSFFLSTTGPRVVVAADARGYFFSSVDLPNLLRTVPTATTSFALTVGVELPWSNSAQ